MSEHPEYTPSANDFLADVERLVTPSYAECFTDETRKVGNLLLLISFVLILLDLGIVDVDRKIELPLPLSSLSFEVTTGMGVLLLILCFYLLLLFALRSYAEWKLWRLRHQASIAGFLDLQDKVVGAWQKEFDRWRTELENAPRSQTAESELKRREAQIVYLKDALRPAGWILRVRFWWEMLFPAAFGTLAIVLGIVTLVRNM